MSGTRRKFNQKSEMVKGILNSSLHEEYEEPSVFDDDVAIWEELNFGENDLARPQRLLNFEELLSSATKPTKNRESRPKRTKNARPASKVARRETPTRANLALAAKKMLQEMPSRPPLNRSESYPSSRRVLSPTQPFQDHTFLSGKVLRTPSRLTCTQSNKLGVKAIQSLVPRPVLPSILGPVLRASLVVGSSTKRAAALLIWGVDNLSVVPLVGCGSSLEESWQFANSMESTILARMTSVVVLPEANKNQTNLARYWSMTCNLASSLPELVGILENLIPSKKRPENRSTLVSSSLRSLEVDVGKSFEHFEMLMSWQQVHEKELSTTYPAVEETQSELGEKVCMVCFETIPAAESMPYLLSCGHSTCCLDCYRDYLQVASESGQGSIVCPAFKCSTSVSFIDSAHILFGPAAEVRATSQEVFSKLVRFELERHGNCDIKGRFCPSPGCGRLLVASSTQTRSLKDGWKILYCSCGNQMCAECPTGGGAHPGLSCARQAHLQQSISSGKVEDDTASMQWLIKYSRPCPECKFPIERFEGCNHVRCQKCQYYFCWQCGGFGNDCMAYFCDKAKRASHESLDFDSSEYQRMEKLLEHFRDYRLSAVRLNSLQKILYNWDSKQKPIPQFLSLSSQVEQVMLWMHGCRASQAIDKNTKTTNDLEMDSCPRLTALQAVNEALFDRLKSKESPPPTTTTTKKNRSVVSKRKRQALEQTRQRLTAKPLFLQHSCENLCSFLASDLKELLRGSSDAVLQKKTKQVIRDGIKHLKPTPAIQPFDSKVPKQEPGLGIQRLNTKLDRQLPSWKNKAALVLGETSPTFRNEKKLTRKQAGWKGKMKVSERRATALSQADIFP